MFVFERSQHLLIKLFRFQAYIETEHGRDEPANFDIDIFGKQYTVTANNQRLPQLFIALTKVSVAAASLPATTREKAGKMPALQKHHSHRPKFAYRASLEIPRFSAKICAYP